MSDLINRADAIEEISKGVWNEQELIDRIKALPSADAVSREEHEELYRKAKEVNKMANDILADFPSYKELVSADAVDVYKAHEEEHLNITNKIKELQYAIAKTQTIVGKMVKSAEAVQGEWEKTKLKDDMWICSACGSPLTTDDISEIHFCPNCGARMKGGAE